MHLRQLTAIELACIRYMRRVPTVRHWTQTKRKRVLSTHHGTVTQQAFCPNRRFAQIRCESCQC